MNANDCVELLLSHCQTGGIRTIVYIIPLSFLLLPIKKLVNWILDLINSVFGDMSIYLSCF